MEKQTILTVLIRHSAGLTIEVVEFGNDWSFARPEKSVPCLFPLEESYCQTLSKIPFSWISNLPEVL